MAGVVSLLLVYEPPSTKRGPVSLARVSDQRLTLEVARTALVEAQVRADQLADADEILGEVEQAEVKRLRQVLSILLPGLTLTNTPVTGAVH
jgi:hypothetical protein